MDGDGGHDARKHLALEMVGCHLKIPLLLEYVFLHRVFKSYYPSLQNKSIVQSVVVNSFLLALLI